MRADARAVIHPDRLAPEPEAAVVVLRERSQQERVAGLQVIAGVGVAAGDRILEADVRKRRVGREAVAVPVLVRRARPVVVRHRDAAQDGVVDGAL